MPGEAVGGGCHASDMGNVGEAHCLETVGGKLRSQSNEPVFQPGDLPSSARTPGRGLSCPSRGVISPDWEAILPEASWSGDWHQRPAHSLTCPSAAGGRGWAGGQLSRTRAHGVSGHKSQGISSGGFPSEFVIQLQYFGGICQDAESNILFILHCWSYLLLPPLSAETP